jgi:hypothetical protein
MENNSREEKKGGRKPDKYIIRAHFCHCCCNVVDSAVQAYEKHFVSRLIYENIYIDDISIGGLTREQAVQKLILPGRSRKNQIEFVCLPRIRNGFLIMRIFN